MHYYFLPFDSSSNLSRFAARRSNTVTPAGHPSPARYTGTPSVVWCWEQSEASSFRQSPRLGLNCSLEIGIGRNQRGNSFLRTARGRGTSVTWADHIFRSLLFMFFPFSHFGLHPVACGTSNQGLNLRAPAGEMQSPAPGPPGKPDYSLNTLPSDRNH